MYEYQCACSIVKKVNICIDKTTISHEIEYEAWNLLPTDFLIVFTLIISFDVSFYWDQIKEYK